MTTGTVSESRGVRGFIQIGVRGQRFAVAQIVGYEPHADGGSRVFFVGENNQGTYGETPEQIDALIAAALDPAPVTGEGRPSIDIVLDMIRSLGKADGRLGVYSYNQLESEMLNAYLAGSAEGEASRAR